MTRVPAPWWVCCRLVEWWAASLRAAPSCRAAVRPAAPVWSAAAGRVGRARPCFTMAATSNLVVSSLSSASQSLPVSSPKRSRPQCLPPAHPAAVWPAPSLPPSSHNPLTLPQWAAPSTRTRLTQRLSLPTKCPYCAPTLFHNLHRKTHPLFVSLLPSHNEGKVAQLGWSTGKMFIFSFLIFAWTWSIIDNLFCYWMTGQ